MTSARTLEARDSVRLFCALRLPDPVLDALERWQRAELAAEAVRVVPRANLHITLAFLGTRPQSDVPSIAGALRAAAAGAAAIELELGERHYRETRSVGMLVLRDVHATAGAVAESLFDRLEELGVYRREQRRWLPHVTVIRFKRPPRLRPGMPAAIGRFSPSDAALYTSVLRPGGAQYEVLESIVVGA